MQVCFASSIKRSLFSAFPSIQYFVFVFRAGCEYGGYTSDITRTWPVNGGLTKSQAVLYEIVNNVQMDLLHVINIAENLSLDNLFDLMCQRLGKYLQQAVMKKDSLPSDEMLRHAAFQFCPHHVSHYLGMDVHDTPLIPRSRIIVPGMVFTVEPGTRNMLFIKLC